MILPQTFCNLLQQQGISFFVGVPDSLLKSLCAYIDEVFDHQQHIITANEGNAVAMAMGHYLATGHPAMAYMQNSGLGNAVNPLTSMACKEVCGIPMLLVIGWRGEPGVPDEPQHVKQGDITLEMLDLMGIPYEVINGESDVEQQCVHLFQTMMRESKPVALVVRKNTFQAVASVKKSQQDLMSREAALEIIQSQVAEQDLLIATTGKTARELYEIQVQTIGECSAFLTVGAMGHTSSIAASVAMAKPNKRVYCLDGDGALLMHMGALAVIGALKPKNLVHVLLNNQVHESVGGQPTSIDSVDVKSLVLANGYVEYIKIESEAELKALWQDTMFDLGPIFVEILIKAGSRNDLGRPEPTPSDNSRTFLQNAK